jgi:hypothetical protein
MQKKGCLPFKEKTPFLDQVGLNSGGVHIQVLAETSNIFTEVLRGFTQSLQQIVRIIDYKMTVSFHIFFSSPFSSHFNIQYCLV